MPTSAMPSRVARTAVMMCVFSPCLQFQAVTYQDLCQYATATFKVLNAYAGWSNVNYVLNEVKNPVRTLKIAGPVGLGICAILYLLANVAYFAYIHPIHLWLSNGADVGLNKGCHQNGDTTQRCDRGGTVLWERIWCNG